MKLLAIDTSGEAQVVALMVGERRILTFEAVGRAHSQRILPAIEGVLTEANIDVADLDAVVFGQGPGSFTGLRIGVGVAQGLAYGAGIPVVPVSTLACLALGEHRRSDATQLVVALVARKQEVFYGCYRIVDGLPVLVGEEGVADASAMPSPGFADYRGVGNGWSLRDAIENAVGARASGVTLDVLPQPEDLLDIGAHYFREGRTVPAMQATPQYLREKVAALPGEREH